MLGDLAAFDRGALACAVRRRTIEIKACRHAAFACSARTNSLLATHWKRRRSSPSEESTRSSRPGFLPLCSLTNAGSYNQKEPHRSTTYLIIQEQTSIPARRAARNVSPATSVDWGIASRIRIAICSALFSPYILKCTKRPLMAYRFALCLSVCYCHTHERNIHIDPERSRESEMSGPSLKPPPSNRARH